MFVPSSLEIVCPAPHFSVTCILRKRTYFINLHTSWHCLMNKLYWSALPMLSCLLWFESFVVVWCIIVWNLYRDLTICHYDLESIRHSVFCQASFSLHLTCMLVSIDAPLANMFWQRVGISVVILAMLPESCQRYLNSIIDVLERSVCQSCGAMLKRSISKMHLNRPSWMRLQISWVRKAVNTSK